MAKMDALIHFCFHRDPESITDFDEYAKLYARARFALQYTSTIEANKILSNMT